VSVAFYRDEQKEMLLEKLREELKEKDSLAEKLISTYKTEISKLNEDLELQRRKNNVSTEINLILLLS
jgi:hypothetical protein